MAAADPGKRSLILAPSLWRRSCSSIVVIPSRPLAIGGGTHRLPPLQRKWKRQRGGEIRRAPSARRLIPSRPRRSPWGKDSPPTSAPAAVKATERKGLGRSGGRHLLASSLHVRAARHGGRTHRLPPLQRQRGRGGVIGRTPSARQQQPTPSPPARRGGRRGPRGRVGRNEMGAGRGAMRGERCPMRNVPTRNGLLMVMPIRVCTPNRLIVAHQLPPTATDQARQQRDGIE
jgi:hypothetical protein